MRIALISDVHSNQVALEAVLAALPPHDQLWCLGDTIGYGPRPNECLALVRERATQVLTGNHDLASLGVISLVDFNSLARQANEWNNRQLKPDLRAYLRERPEKITTEPDVTLAHASPRDPIWEYIDSIPIARANFAHFSTRLCLVGHTHVPMLVELDQGGQMQFGHMQHGEVSLHQPGSRYIVNPGSVGQPRDGNPEAAYAIWDTDAATIEFRRIGYDVGATQKQMLHAGLPVLLAERLAYGQ